ncbi:MAG: hypothetical protein ACTSV2_15290 [Candidatus Thorarchaeota archaeon]
MKSMNKKALAIVVSLIAISKIVLIAIGTSPAWNLTWNVEEGDNFTYRIISNYHLIDLNNTLISVNISQLPDLFPIITPATFSSSIIETDKITVLFQNGSELMDYENSVYGFISRTILPCGDWGLLDAMYPSTNSTSYSYTGYSSTLETSYFALEYGHVDFDSSSGWIAHVSLETGIPFYIQRWSYDTYPDDYYLRMNLRILMELFLEA